MATIFFRQFRCVMVSVQFFNQIYFSVHVCSVVFSRLWLTNCSKTSTLRCDSDICSGWKRISAFWLPFHIDYNRSIVICFRMSIKRLDDFCGTEFWVSFSWLIRNTFIIHAIFIQHVHCVLFMAQNQWLPLNLH